MPVKELEEFLKQANLYTADKFIQRQDELEELNAIKKELEEKEMKKKKQEEKMRELLERKFDRPDSLRQVVDDKHRNDDN